MLCCICRNKAKFCCSQSGKLFCGIECQTIGGETFSGVSLTNEALLEIIKHMSALNIISFGLSNDQVKDVLHIYINTNDILKETFSAPSLIRELSNATREQLKMYFLDSGFIMAFNVTDLTFFYSLQNDENAKAAKFILEHNLVFGKEFTIMFRTIYKDKKRISLNILENPIMVTGFDEFNQLLFKKLGCYELGLLLTNYRNQFTEEYVNAFLFDIAANLNKSISDLQKLAKVVSDMGHLLKDV